MNANISPGAIASAAPKHRDTHAGSHDKDAASARTGFDRALDKGAGKKVSAQSSRGGAEETERPATETQGPASERGAAAKLPNPFWKFSPVTHYAPEEETLPPVGNADFGPEAGESLDIPPSEAPAVNNAAPDVADPDLVAENGKADAIKPDAAIQSDPPALRPVEGDNRSSLAPEVARTGRPVADAAEPARARGDRLSGPAATSAPGMAETIPQSRPAPVQNAPVRNGPEQFNAAKPAVTAGAEAAIQQVRAEAPPVTNSPAAREQPAAMLNTKNTADDTTTPQPRVTVLGGQNIAAPNVTPAPLGTTGQSVVAALEAAPELRAMPSEAISAAGQRQIGQNVGTSTLKIQLQPAELGMVTARLTVTGSQLSVEIQVDNSDAWQRLSSESDAIVKALRAVGYDIDKVNIQQNQQPASNAGPQAGSGREQQSAQAQADGREGNGRWGTDGGGEHDDGRPRNGFDTNTDRSDGGLYI